MRMPIQRALTKYIENIDKVILFSIFIILTLSLSFVMSSFISAGSGFIRFTSIYADLTIPQVIIMLGVSLVSIILISIFLSALISTIKLQETLDQVTYKKVTSVFKKYVLQMTMFLILLTVISIAIGTFLTYIGTPTVITQAVILILWVLFIFTPQIIVLEDFGVIESLKDSLSFIERNPIPLAKYIVVGFILMFLLTLIEVFLGQFFIWAHQIITVVLVSILVLPFLQIYATELYLKRYPLTGI